MVSSYCSYSANVGDVASQAALRSLFAKELSQMFSNEVQEYKKFTHIVRESNESFLANNPEAFADPEDRVMAEKHGAIRVGTPEEMRMVTRIFAVFGMCPVEFYDLTKLPKGALPMIATAFRPIDDTINTSAFRMFCSMLHEEHIPEEIKEDVLNELSARRENNPKFSSELRRLLTLAETRGLTGDEGREFIKEAVRSFKINKDKLINFDLYSRLRKRSDILADIICIGININHLTPRVYDIEDTAKRLKLAGIHMKDGGIEGPLLRNGAATILLNQTSCKAPGESLYVSNNKDILLLETDSSKLHQLKSKVAKVSLMLNEKIQSYLERIEAALKINPIVEIEHKARFGEIEARGVALTQKGNALYQKLLNNDTFKTDYPQTHLELFEQDLAYYKVQTLNGTNVLLKPNDFLKKSVIRLVKKQELFLVPITYEDFLSTSAAGIFKSNLSIGIEENNISKIDVSSDNKANLEGAMGRKIVSQYDLYQGCVDRTI